jgi:hypothetical protein
MPKYLHFQYGLKPQYLIFFISVTALFVITIMYVKVCNTEYLANADLA